MPTYTHMHNFDVALYTIKKLGRLVDIYVNNTHGYDNKFKLSTKHENSPLKLKIGVFVQVAHWHKGRSDTAANSKKN